MNYSSVLQICVVVIILLICVISFFTKKKSKWSDPEEFVKRKKYISKNCNEQELRKFMHFLREYGGGYVKTRNGSIVHQDYLGREKGDLKGIFYSVVVPSAKVTTQTKEEYRQLICKIGVTGVSARPEYERRDGKLKNKEADTDNWERKQAGNHGEALVRKYLKKLDPAKYFVVSGVVLEYKGEKREFDHLVIGNDILYILETKAFGMAQDELYGSYAEIRISPDDHWVLTKNGHQKELVSPTKQVMEQRKFMEKVLHASYVDILSVVVLANPELQIAQNAKLEYGVVSVNNLQWYIEKTDNKMQVGSREELIQKIDRARIN